MKRLMSPAIAIAAGALHRLVRIVHRCGVSGRQIERIVRDAVRNLPQESTRVHVPLELEMPSAPHVLTLWRTDPAYIDSRGEPLPLDLVGPEISIEALVQKVDPRLNAQQVLNYLIRANSVRVDGQKYRAIARAVILRGIEGPRDFRDLRSIHAMLRTVEHNLLPPSDDPVGWLERFAENARVPKSRLPAFDKFLRNQTMGYLDTMDAWLETASNQRVGDEPICTVMVGMYLSQSEYSPPNEETLR